MAKRVKSASMTLKDFYEKAPGQAPFENRLPSKPGMTKTGGSLDRTDVESIESRFSDMSMGPHGGYDSLNGSPFKGNGFLPSLGPYQPGSGGLMGSERNIWLPQQPVQGFQEEYTGYDWKHSSSSSDTFSVGSVDMHGSGYPVYRQPPPPPPRQPYTSDAAGRTAQDWSPRPSSPRRPEAQTAIAKEAPDEDSFHYDAGQLVSPPAEEPPQNVQMEAPGQPWRRSPTTGGKTGVAPVSMDRPRLQLKPRSKPLADGGAAQPAADVGAQRRPRLHLQPRSKPLTDQRERQSNIFGASRPREEVLKERGVDPIAADLARSPPPEALAAAVAAKSTISPVLREVAAKQENEWQTVGNRRSRQGDSFGAANSDLFEGDNPLLSHTMPMPLHVDGLHAPFERTYYQPGAHRGMYGGGPTSWTEPDESDGSGFPGRRGLPTRRDDLF
ncbi:hypothetical protein COCOBI_01-2690 [Coccomyxa sp. Obi]|nr:hypothetical protein COCOBI_01-2690 [Coccomyxa sp. Obi]